MAFFCRAIRRYSVFLLRFPFLSNVQVFPCEILPVCRLKCPYCCFASHIWFLVIAVLLTLVLFVLYLVVVKSISLFFLCSLQEVILWFWRFNAGKSYSNFFFSLFHLWNARPHATSCVFLFPGHFLEFFHFKNCSDYLTRRTAKVFILLMRCLLYNLVLSIFSHSPEVYFLKNFLLFPRVWWYPLPIFQSICKFSFSPSFDFFSIW